MLKIRVLPTLLQKGATLVKGVGFDSWRRVGSPMQAVNVFNMRDVDELAFLDILATAEDQEPDYDLVHDLAIECHVPFSIGGGIRTVEHVSRLLKVGADKVVVNTAFFEQPETVANICRRFGSQAIIVSIDARKFGDGDYRSFSRAGTFDTGTAPVSAARDAEQLGAGEILITSIERDGTMQGYDVDLIHAVANAVRIPVIASGGAGAYEHMAAALDAGAAAVAAASMFQFTEQTPREAKIFLRDRGYPVRL